MSRTSKSSIAVRDAVAMKELQRIPNIGPSIAQDLIRLKIRSLKDLAGKEPEKLYARLCRMDGVRHDPCLLDVFTAVVKIADGGPARPWWEYSRLRKLKGKNEGCKENKCL